MTADRSERRRSQRRPILDSFSLFVVVPRKGMHRLKVHDVSNFGIGFDADIEGEALEEFPISPGESLELQFYLNQSLFLPLALKVARVQTVGSVRRIGAEFSDKESKGYLALQAFLTMLDTIAEVARLEPKAG